MTTRESDAQERVSTSQAQQVRSPLRDSRLVVAILASTLVILTGPVMGQARARLQAMFPGAYVPILVGAVAFVVGGGTLVAFFRIRHHRAARLGALAVALTIAVVYSTLTAVDQAAINAVERLHFVEYGLLAWLYVRVWRHLGSPASILLPLLASLIVSTLDEWFQWFVPVRVGEMRDVVLNLVAICCGLIGALAATPLPRWSARLDADGWRLLSHTAAIVVALLAGFVGTVHLGHLVRADDIGAFRSHYTAEALMAHASNRAERWRTNPPRTLRRFSVEDQYMDEGLWHIQRRNGLWAANAFARARQENLILERFYAPVLDTSTYALPRGARWPAEQRAFVETYAGQLAAPFASDAEPYTVLTWPRPLFWSLAALTVAALLGLPRRRAVR